MKVQEARLEDLIRRLEAERGMGQKVRLLVGSWPLLRELSPQQRERVALAVGSRWALRHLEGMFGHPDKLSENQLRVQAIFERMSDADVNELRRLGEEIRQGGSSAARSRLLGALEDALEEKLAAEAGTDVGRPPPPAWLPATLLEELDEPARPTRTAQPEQPLPPVPPEIPEQLGPVDEPEEADSPQPAVARAELAEPGVDLERPEAVDTEPTRTTSEGSLELAGAAATAAATAAPAAKISRPELVHEAAESPAEGAQEEGAFEAASEEAPAGRRHRDAVTLSAVDSLRALRRLASGETASSPAGRAAMIASLGSGWAARRAVSSMIRSRSAADLDEALALIRSLASATEQTWCLGDLLQHWQLDDVGRERVLAAAPTEAARRRLARRAARAG
ncbi:MAG: hypothetical protein GY769_04805 [bacterium]|nr:hypothetical protein [bacterium]